MNQAVISVVRSRSYGAAFVLIALVSAAIEHGLLALLRD